MESIKKIHHISAIVGNPKVNVQFYEEVLKLRLVKQTVNFDDPETYHLYYGNQTADPGTIMTFFPWSTTSRGKVGSGQVGRIAFRIPKGSLGFWNERLTSYNIDFEMSSLFLNRTIEFTDSHGLALALVENTETSNTPDIVGFHGAVLLSSEPIQTVITLRDDLGFELIQEGEADTHLKTVGEEAHHLIVPKEVLPPGRFGVGTVHHIAWSVPNESIQVQWQEKLYDKKYGVTEVKDREYFKAIYFVERGNIVFEIATDGPGFMINESLDTLGQTLMLPSQFESRREALENSLPKLREESNDGEL